MSKKAFEHSGLMGDVLSQVLNEDFMFDLFVGIHLGLRSQDFNAG